MKFWKWWAVFSVTAAVIFVSQYLWNLFAIVHDADQTNMSFAIAIVGFFGMLGVGWQAFRVSFLKKQLNDTTLLWYISDLCLSLGMIGTLVGIYIGFTTSTHDLDISSTASLQHVLIVVFNSLGTAIMTSLVGIVFALLIKLQLVFLTTGETE